MSDSSCSAFVLNADHVVLTDFNNDFRPESFLLLAETIAKVTYNASGQPAPFDFGSGWYIPSLAFQTALSFKDDRLIPKFKRLFYYFTITSISGTISRWLKIFDL
jgi:hypothetical protein